MEPEDRRMPKGNTKEKIIQAAEIIIAKKGKSATISEIGAKSGVTDSVIYHYFKNKDDLMFSVLKERIKVGLDKIAVHLTGIRDPVSKLSKMIWLQLRQHEDLLDYTTLLLFECRSNAKFRKHEAHKLMRKWGRHFTVILEEGKASGLFNADLNVTLARDAILGLLDMENIFCIAAGEKQAGLTVFEEIVDLVIVMIQPQKESLPQNKDRTRTILMAAEQVFAKQGYDSATISDIASNARVSEGAIYEYFKNKEDLLFSLLSRRFESNAESLDELFQIKNPIRKLRRFMRYHFTLFSTQPENLKTFLSSGIYNRNFFTSSAFPKFMTYLLTIDSILDEGKEAKLIRENLDNRIFRNLFLGAFCHMTLRWQFADWSHTNKLQEVNEIIDLLTEAVIVSKDSFVHINTL